MQKKTLVFDAQILQTPALNRGMGQYVRALLFALHQQLSAKGSETKLIVVCSSHADTEDNKALKKYLQGMDVIELPLVTVRQSKNTKSAIAHNQTVIDQWIRNSQLQDVSFLVSSLFQAEIYPAFPTDAQKLAIMYDVIPLQLFNQYAPKMKWSDYLTRYKLVYDADKLLCISKTTANDVLVYTGVRPDKLVLINGGPGDLSEVQKPKQTSSGRFVLMPTGNDIRKNNQLAVEAFELYQQQSGSNLTLVLTSHFAQEEMDRLKKISPALYFTGILSDAELAWYFANCELLLFPSTYEGLGMPLIEAMLFNKPIAASSIDVFLEISSSSPYFFNPFSVEEIKKGIDAAITGGVKQDQKLEYQKVVAEYSWENSANKVIGVLRSKVKTQNAKTKIAMVGPHVTGVSAIGKFIADIYPALSAELDVDYFYEKSPIDKVLRGDVLGHVVNYRSVYELTDSLIKKYDAIVYHIGNSNHHMLTAARALTKPSIVVLHDMNLENVYKALLEEKLISESRVKAEHDLDELAKTKSAYVQSIAGRQAAVVTHSNYVKDVVTELVDKDKTEVVLAQLSVGTPVYDVPRRNEQFTIGLAGILAGIKGLSVIESIARHPDFANDKIMLFGLNFAEPGLLESIRELPNVEITADPTDFDFQEKLKRLDLFVNYRKKYQGEASYSTLEAMRYGVPVLVRSDFGWYSELPDGAVIKVKDEADILAAVQKVKADSRYRQLLSERARVATAELFSHEKYVETLKAVIDGVKK